MRRLRQSWQRAILTITVFLLAYNLNDLLRPTGLWRTLRQWSFFAVIGTRNILQIALCYLGVACVGYAVPKRAARELGLIAPVGRAFVFAALSSLPMLLAFSLSSKLNAKFTLGTLFFLSVLAPFAEEVVFRGYLFGQLYRRAGWSFWPASLIVAILFGLGHSYQMITGKLGIDGLLGVIAITGLGSVFFSWLLVRWQFNLWVPFAIHCLMNLWWELFSVDQTALGGWLANLARLATIALAILLTRYQHLIWRPVTAEPSRDRDEENHAGDSLFCLGNA